MILSLLVISGCSYSSTNYYPISDHYNGDVFYNPDPIRKSNLLSLIKHVLFGRSGE